MEDVYQKYINQEYSKKLLLRIKDRIIRTNNCWLYDSVVWWDGYCRIKISNSGRVQRRVVHRVYWELLNGLIPRGLTLDHLCRVRNCVNPKHLEIVTQRQNTLRGISPAAINFRKTHCIKGHKFDTKNTYLWKNKYRICRECAKIKSAEWRIKRRQG